MPVAPRSRNSSRTVYAQPYGSGRGGATILGAILILALVAFGGLAFAALNSPPETTFPPAAAVDAEPGRS